MLGVQMREANGSLAVCLDAADVSEYLLLFRSAGEHGRHIGVELRKALHEFLDTDMLQGFRHQSRHQNVRHLQRQAHFSAQNDEFARHVHSRQVVARIGFSITFELGRSNDR